MAVVTVGRVDAGTKSNIIPDEATLYLNTRAYSKKVADTLHASIERVIKVKCSLDSAIEALVVAACSSFVLDV